MVEDTVPSLNDGRLLESLSNTARGVSRVDDRPVLNAAFDSAIIASHQDAAGGKKGCGSLLAGNASDKAAAGMPVAARG